MKLAFKDRKFYGKTRELLSEIDAICTTFYAKGYVLSLRQLFYQLVSRTRIQNTDKAYKNLGDVVKNGRYAGVLDWEHIQDRVRVINGNVHWDGPEDRIHCASESHAIDTWIGQSYRPEVWIEKDALIEVAARPCELLDVDYIAVKAYSSVSARWEARKRFREYIRNGQTPVILHLGDLDCTGDDCSRFLNEDMELLTGHSIELVRLALNPNQVEQYELPPQPGKTADPRFKGYVKKHGTSHVWELDALDPEVIEQIIEDGIRAVMDEDLRAQLLARQAEEKACLARVSEHRPHVEEFTSLMSDGHRAGYEAWRHLSMSHETEQLQKSTIADFQPYRVSPMRTERDADIAEEFAEVVTRA